MFNRKIIAVLFIVGLVGMYFFSTRNADTDKATTQEEAGRRLAPEGTNKAIRGPVRPLRAVGTLPRGLVRIEGIVVDGVSSEGVSAVDVALISSEGETTVTSDSRGAFTANLLPGAYNVRVDGENIVSLAQPPFMAGGLSGLLRIEVLSLAEIRGRVVDASGAGVEGAQVLASSTLGSRVLGPEDLNGAGVAKSEGDGSFSIFVAPGELELSAAKARKKGEQWISGVAPASLVKDVLIRVAAGVDVGGRVENAEGGTLADAQIQMTVYVNNKYETFVVASDERGEFTMEAVPAGTLTIEAWKEGHGATAEASYLDLAEGESKKDLVLVVRGPLKIEGRVVDSKGAPMRGVRVAVIAESSRRPRDWRPADSSGHFLFDDLGPGPHTIYAGKNGYPDVTAKVTAPAPGTLQLKLVQGGSIEGRVVSPSGERIPSFSVRVERFVSSLDGLAKRMKGSGEMAGSNGSFTMNVFHPGTYVVLITAPGYGSKRIVAEVPVDGNANLDVTLAKSGSVQGRVLSEGRPIGGARVSMIEGYAGPPVFSDASGEFQMTNVTPGLRLVSISKTGYATSFIDGVSVRSDASAKLRAELSEAGGSEYAGIGVDWSETANFPVVFGVSKGSGASKVGLRRDDFVLGIDGIPTFGMSRTGARELVRGVRSTMVRLDIERAGRRFFVMVKRG